MDDEIEIVEEIQIEPKKKKKGKFGRNPYHIPSNSYVPKMKTHPCPHCSEDLDSKKEFYKHLGMINKVLEFHALTLKFYYFDKMTSILHLYRN